MNEKRSGQIIPSYNALSTLFKLADLFISNNKIKTIFEFGSRYGEDTIEFAKKYPQAIVYGFECNPNTLEECKSNVKQYPNIVLTEKAVSDVDGFLTFYSIDKEKTKTTWIDGNQGASSLFKSSGKYELEEYVQNDVEVQSIKLESFMIEKRIENVDLLWMDVQGAELKALKGLGCKINSIKLIQLEVEFTEIYSGQPLFDEINEFLKKNDFIFLGFSFKSDFSADAIFLNGNLYNKRKIKKSNKIIESVKERTNISIQYFIIKLIKKLLTIFYNYFLIYVFKLLRGIKKFDKSFPITCPEITKRGIFLWYLRTVKPLFGLDKQYIKNRLSYTSIDVVIPVSPKDAESLETVIKSAKEYVKHPINNIYIVSPDNKNIKLIAKTNNCIFVNEIDLMTFSKEKIKYIHNDIDRSGWLYQQLIKLSIDSFCEEEYILVLDADTRFVKDKVFIFNEKQIFDMSEERHEPYHLVFQKMFGFETKSKLSFISHNMLFKKSYLIEMKKYIEERHKKSWIDVILQYTDYDSISGFSEYESYGNYMMKFHRKKLIREFWFNYAASNFFVNYPNFIKTYSVHSYFKEN